MKGEEDTIFACLTTVQHNQIQEAEALLAWRHSASLYADIVFPPNFFTCSSQHQRSIISSANLVLQLLLIMGKLHVYRIVITKKSTNKQAKVKIYTRLGHSFPSTPSNFILIFSTL